MVDHIHTCPIKTTVGNPLSSKTGLNSKSRDDAGFPNVFAAKIVPRKTLSVQLVLTLELWLLQS